MFQGGFFWMIMGALFVLVGISAPIWMEDLKIKMNKVRWTLLIVWFLFVLLTVASPLTLIAENEAVAGFHIGLIFLVLAIITGVALWRYLLTVGRKEA